MLDGADGSVVGIGGLVPQGEQRVEVGDPGDGGAARDAAEEIAAVQAAGVEARADPGAELRHDGRERRGDAVQGAFPQEVAVPVQARAVFGHGAGMTRRGAARRSVYGAQRLR